MKNVVDDFEAQIAHVIAANRRHDRAVLVIVVSSFILGIVLGFILKGANCG